MKKNEKLIIITIILVILSNTLVYFTLNEKFEKQNLDLSENLVKSHNLLTNQIKNTNEYSKNEREILKTETINNFAKLQDYFNTETTKLKLNLESQVGNVKSDLETVKSSTEQGLEDITSQVGNLEGKISEIDVESSDFSAIVEDVVKAVVNVQTNNGQGSGVFFADGYIMTNKHVIEGASAIRVVDYNGEVYNVQILGVANTLDLAVLKIISNKSFSYLKFADNVNVGQRVIAVGNPLGLSFSVTEGIISATNRQIDNTDVKYIQTDVSINPGNSGGPLVNSGKRIVGINTLKIDKSEGLGFALPYNVVKEIADLALSKE